MSSRGDEGTREAESNSAERDERRERGGAAVSYSARRDEGTLKKNIYTFLVILANLTNQMRVNFKVHTHFQGMRALV